MCNNCKIEQGPFTKTFTGPRKTGFWIQYCRKDAIEDCAKRRKKLEHDEQVRVTNLG